MTTMVEPEWDESTRAVALALDAVPMCPLCGLPTSICQNPEMQDQWVGDNPVRCHVQTARLARQKGVTEETNPQAGALTWPVTVRKTGSHG